MTAGWPNISALSTTDFQRGLKNAHNALYWLIRITNSYIPVSYTHLTLPTTAYV